MNIHPDPEAGNGRSRHGLGSGKDHEKTTSDQTQERRLRFHVGSTYSVMELRRVRQATHRIAMDRTATVLHRRPDQCTGRNRMVVVVEAPTVNGCKLFGKKNEVLALRSAAACSNPQRHGCRKFPHARSSRSIRTSSSTPPMTILRTSPGLADGARRALNIH